MIRTSGKYMAGQKKLKVLLARSFLAREPTCISDEPLNYIDVLLQNTDEYC